MIMFEIGYLEECGLDQAVCKKRSDFGSRGAGVNVGRNKLARNFAGLTTILAVLREAGKCHFSGVHFHGNLPPLRLVAAFYPQHSAVFIPTYFAAKRVSTHCFR